MKPAIYLVLIILLVSAKSHINGNKISQNKKIFNVRDDTLNYKSYSVFINSNYSTNTNFFGNTNLFKSQPSYNANIEFLLPFNLNIGSWITGIENSNDSLNQTTYDYGINFSYDIKLVQGKFTLSPTYYRYFYSKNSTTVKKFFKNNFSIDINLKLKQFTIGLTGTYLTGTYETFQLNFYNMFIFEKEKLFFKNSYFSYAPTILLLYGKLDYLNNYYFKEYPYLMLNYLERRDYYEIFWLKRHNPNITREEIIDYFASKKSTDNFHLTSIAIVFPLTYVINNFGININCSVLIPYGYPDYFDKSIQYIIEAGISYLIDF